MTSNKLIFRQRCISQENISQATVVAMLPEGSRQREWFEALDRDKWTITSFDSKRREVCINVTTDTGVNYVSVVLPYLAITSTDSP